MTPHEDILNRAKKLHGNAAALEDAIERQEWEKATALGCKVSDDQAWVLAKVSHRAICARP